MQGLPRRRNVISDNPPYILGDIVLFREKDGHNRLLGQGRIVGAGYYPHAGEWVYDVEDLYCGKELRDMGSRDIIKKLNEKHE